MNAVTPVFDSAAVRGAMERALMLPSLNSSHEATPFPMQSSGGWSNNWADWDNSGGHNDWENGNPSPPGG